MYKAGHTHLDGLQATGQQHSQLVHAPQCAAQGIGNDDGSCLSCGEDYDPGWPSVCALPAHSQSLLSSCLQDAIAGTTACSGDDF